MILYECFQSYNLIKYIDNQIDQRVPVYSCRPPETYGLVNIVTRLESNETSKPLDQGLEPEATFKIFDTRILPILCYGARNLGL